MFGNIRTDDNTEAEAHAHSARIHEHIPHTYCSQHKMVHKIDGQAAQRSTLHGVCPVA